MVRAFTTEDTEGTESMGGGFKRGETGIAVGPYAACRKKRGTPFVPQGESVGMTGEVIRAQHPVVSGHETTQGVMQERTCAAQPVIRETQADRLRRRPLQRQEKRIPSRRGAKSAALPSFLRASGLG